MDANIREIYNILLAGKKVKLPFSSEKEAETFRVSLHKFKSRQDEQLIGLGFLEERQKLCFSVLQVEPELPIYEEPQLIPIDPFWIATFSFQDRVAMRTFSITVIEPSEEDEE